MREEITFRHLEDEVQGCASIGQSPLEVWYERVRDTPIRRLSDEDVCIACRQELNLEFVVPVAILRLQENPLTGESFDGELLVALAGVPRSFWNNHRMVAHELRSLIDGIEIPYQMDDISQARDTLRARLEA